MTSLLEEISPVTRANPETPPSRSPVLVVDDCSLDRRMAGRLVEKSGRFRALYARNGQEAVTTMAREKPCLVVTDLHMPEMDGLQLVETIHGRFPGVPVILMTAQGSADIALQALQKGAASYVPKADLYRDLPTTLEQVQAAAAVDRPRQQALAALTRREAHFRLENDPAVIPALARLLQEELDGQAGDEAIRTQVGIALEEALGNALYHGNLELDAALRRQDAAAFQKLVEQRRRLTPYLHRRLHVYSHLTPAEARYVITDQGPGFDIARLPDMRDAACLEKAAGRGLVLIHAFMDKVSFNAAGNQITLVKRRTLSPENLS